MTNLIGWKLNLLTHGDRYVWVLTVSKVIESIDFILTFQDFPRQ